MDRVNKPLPELVDELPTESLEMYVAHYEAGMVGGYWGSGVPVSGTGWHPVTGCRCPRSSLGFRHISFREGSPPDANTFDSSHPADRIEIMALRGGLDTHALYSECVLAIMERDGAMAPRPAEVPA